MILDIVTKKDLEDFGNSLVDRLKGILPLENVESKKYLKSGEARRILKISQGTLQNLRRNKTLGFTKIGSIYYYKLEDVTMLLERGNVDFSPATANSGG